MLIVIILLSFTVSQGQKSSIICPQLCEMCLTSPNVCNACINEFQLSYSGQCINSSTIDNCMLYGLRNTCISCKPSFRLLYNNTCSKMLDGCLISDTNGACSKCIEGAIKSQYGQCENKYLNCLKVSQYSQCILCQLGYTLMNGRCINNDLNCQYYQSVNGLCMACKAGYRLIAYKCIQPQKGLNCYIISEDFQTCSYCKSGYQSYYGQCYTSQKIEFLFYQENTTKKCTSSQYYDPISKLCYPQPQNCEKFDFGFMRCVFCKGTYVLISGICRDPSLRYCEQFDHNNSLSCLICQANFFLYNDSTNLRLCKEYVPFCIQVFNQKCIKCSDQFLLNSKGFCQDPNCATFNTNTYQCLTCKPSFFKLANNICTFSDLNCIQLGPNDTCNKCKNDYVYDAVKKLCKYVDPNCKIFSQKDICLECRSGYYMDQNANLCLELPFKCLSANSTGACIYCSEGYVLMINRQCGKFINISNCEIPSEINPNLCQKCKVGFYKDQNGMCFNLPILCDEFDSMKNLCTKCNKNAVYKNGLCFDNFCQFFGNDAQCLGCKTGYQFSKNGQCVPVQADPNCKQFSNGQCKICSDRYYFNKQWKCTNVSTLCKAYDSNNGDCTSCYSGYVLDQGQCIRESQAISCDLYIDGNKTTCQKCHSGYKFNSKDGKCYLGEKGCSERSLTNKTCLRCQPEYLLDQGSGSCLKVSNYSFQNSSNLSNSNQTKTQYTDENCITFSSDGMSCIKCASRMYYSKDKGKCTAIDPNCKNYIQLSGQCMECYGGYNLTIDMMACQLAKGKDKNCKTFLNNSNECLQCYNGYYYSNQLKQCTLVNSLCKTFDEKNGNCLSCWAGYALKGSQCILENLAPQVQKEQGNLDIPNAKSTQIVNTTFINKN